MTHPFEHALPLINLLHEQPTTTALIEMTALGPKRKASKYYHVNPVFCADWAIELNQQGYSVFLNVNPRKAMSAFDRDVAYTTALVLDLQPEKVNIGEVIDRLAAAGIPPTVHVDSGHGAHLYLKLVEPADPILAKSVAERLCTATGSDRIFNPGRILRLPGSVNWKSRKAPRWCFLVNVWPERRYTLTKITEALNTMGAPVGKVAIPALPRQPIAPAFDWYELRSRLSAHALEIIDSGERNPFSEKQSTRSEVDWLVICELVRADATDDQILWIYSTQPIGDLKFQGKAHHYLSRTIESVRRTVGAQPPWFRNASLKKRLARQRTSP